MPIKQDIPVPEILERNLADDDVIRADAAVYHVSSWRPGPAHSDGPCSQVHLALPLCKSNGEHVLDLVLRLKSARALDELVGVLLEYRREVWGGGR